MDYNFGLGITPYMMGTNNMWSSPYMMNPMMFNPMLQFPPAPQFSLQKPQTQQGPTVEAAAALQAQQAQKAPEFNLHDVANAGDVMPVAMQGAEKRAVKYRRSEEFGKTITKEQGNATRGIDRRISSLNINRKKIELLEKRLADAKAAEKVDAKAVKSLEEQLAKAQKKYDINSKYIQKDLLKARIGDLKNAKLEKQFLNKYITLLNKGEKGEKALAKLMANPKYHSAASKLSRQLGDIKALKGVSKLSVRDTIGVVQNNLSKASSELDALQGSVKGLKLTGTGAKLVGRAGWAVAIGLEGYEVYQVADKHGWASKQTAKKTTSAAAGLAGAFGGAKLGALAGAKVGALIGSIFPGAGTAIGAGIGGFLGGLIGGAVGYWGAQKAADATFDATMGKTEYNA